VSEHRAERRRFGVEQHRQMARLQIQFAGRHQGAEAILSDGVVQNGNTVFLEVRRHVHGGLRPLS
jgi:hypothetical protein